MAQAVVGTRSGVPMNSVVRHVLDNPSATVAVVAAALAFVSGVLGPLVQLLIGRRQAKAAQTSANAAMLAARNAGYREIARLRMEWMSKLRDTLAEYHSMLMSLDGDEKTAASQKLSELGTQLDLLLNQKDTRQKALWDVADKIFKLENIDERQAMDKDLIEAGREVFKGEWEKVKAEMRGEPFQTGE